MSRWKVRCQLLWIDVSRPPVHPPLLGINVVESHGSHYDKKKERSFSSLTVELISLFYLSLWVPSPMTKVIIQGKSGKPLEYYFTWPWAFSLGDLLFCHSFLRVPKTLMSLLGQDLLSQLKTQNLLHPGIYLCCPLLQEQIDSTVWTDKMSVGQLRQPSLFK
jgi:hypothetical protein